jgi:hypothetical protein
MRRAGLSGDAIAILAKKAGAKTIDVPWFNELDLDIKRLDFLARDANTPWRLFKKVLDNPFDTAAREALDKALRGAAGEMLAAELLPTMLPQFTLAGRQAAMRSSILDFLLRAPGRTGSTVGLEVKAWNKAVWDTTSARALQAASHKAMTPEQLAIEMFDGLVGQLKTRRTPRLVLIVMMMTKSASQTTLDETFLQDEGRQTEPAVQGRC